MKRKRILVSTLLVFCLFLPGIGRANYFEVDGFTVEVLWKVKGEKLIAWGDVEGGNSCKRIDMGISFENRKLKESAYVNASIKRPHKLGDRSIFNGESDISSRNGKYDWVVEDIYLNCLE